MTKGLVVFALTELFMSLTPGPAVLLAISQGRVHDRLLCVPMTGMQRRARPKALSCYT